MRTRRFGDYHFLSEDELKQIHAATLRILNEVGVKVPDERMLKLAQSKGADVNFSDSVIKLPAALIEKYLADNAASYKKNGFKFAEDGERPVTYGITGQSVRAVDVDSGKIRDVTHQDVADASRVVSAIDELPFDSGLFKSMQVPALTDDLYLIHSMLSHGTKPCSMDILHVSSIPWIEEMAIIMHGSKEAVRKAGILKFTAYVTSPLQYPQDAMAKMWAAFDRGYQVGMGFPMSVAGASSPVTLAGSVVSCNADAVAGVVLTRMIDPVNVAYFGAAPITMDLQTGAGLYACPRKLALCGAMNDIEKYYGFCGGGFHLGVDASYPGLQAAAERVFTTMIGVAYFQMAIWVRVGTLGPSDACASLVQVMIDLEIGKMIEKFIEGINVTPETMAVDAIIEAGIGGSFLAHDHTAEFFRQESWLPQLFERRLLEATPQRDIVYEKARDKVKNILKNSDPHPLSKDKQKALDDLLQRAVKAITGSS